MSHSSFLPIQVCSFILLLLFSACKESTQETTHTVHSKQQIPPEPGRTGGVRRMAINSLPTSLNPYLSSDQASLNVIYQLFTGLIRLNAQNQKLEPALAERWEISSDQKQYRFYLRKGLKWSDGHILDARDVVFTYQQILAHPQINSNYRDFWRSHGDLPQVSAPDSLTVIFQLKQAFAPALFNFAAPIMPKHILDSSLKRNTRGELPFLQSMNISTPGSQIVGNGPWKFQRMIPGQRLDLIRNLYYYERDAQGNPLPYLEAMHFIELGDPNTALLQFERGELDHYNLRLSDYPRIKALQKSGKAILYNLGPTPSQLFVMFNQSLARNTQGKALVDPIKVKWFRDLRFRQALAHSIDKNGIIHGIYQGRAESQFSHLSRLNPYYDTGLKDYTYNPQQAAKLLFDAGFRQNAQGQLYDASGNPVQFNLTSNTGSPEREAICNFLARTWSKLGIQVNYRPQAMNTLMRHMHEDFDWEVMVMGFAGSPLEPHFSISRWQREGRMHLFNKGSGPQWKGKPTQFENWETDMEKLYTQASLTLDTEKRKEYYVQAQQLERQHLPFLYLVSELNLLAVSPHLKNLHPSVYGGSGLQQLNWNSQLHFLKSPQNQ